MSHPPLLPTVRAFPGPAHAVLLTLGVLGVQVAVGMVFGIVSAFRAGLAAKGVPAPLTLPPAAILATNLVAFAVVLGWAARANRGQGREVWRGGRAGPVAWVAAVVAGLGATIPISAGGNFMLWLLPLPKAMVALFGRLADLEANPLIGVLTVIVVPAIVEEALFRGYILRGLLDHLRPWPAIGLSTLLFTVLHLNPWQVPVGVLLGLLCGWVYLRTRSLPLCILLHAVNNTVAVFATKLPITVAGFNDGATTGVAHPGWFDALGVALLLAGLGAFAWLTRRLMAPPPLPPIVSIPPLLPVLAAGDAAGPAGRPEDR